MKAVSIAHVGRQTEVKVRHLLVEKVKGVCEGPAVELGFDPLRVCVWGELLARVLRHQKQCVVLGVRDPKLVSAEQADLLGSRVRVNNQRFGRAARAGLLQGHTEIVLRGQKQTWWNSAQLVKGSSLTVQVAEYTRSNQM